MARLLRSHKLAVVCAEADRAVRLPLHLEQSIRRPSRNKQIIEIHARRKTAQGSNGYFLDEEA